MSLMTPAQIKALQANEIDFDTVISGWGNEDFADFLTALAGYLASGDITTLPSSNVNIEVESWARLVQVLQSYKQKLLLLSRSEVSSNIGSYKFDDTDIVNSILPFSALTGLDKYPTNADQFMVFKAGKPIATGDTTSRFDGDAILLKGTGIQFSEAWAGGTNGVVWMLTGPAADLAKQYTFAASSFSGSGYRTANLGNLGADIRGRGITTIPNDVDQLMVMLHGDGLLTEGAGESWVASGFGGSDPTVTFQFDLLPDQYITFLILR